MWCTCTILNANWQLATLTTYYYCWKFDFIFGFSNLKRNINHKLWTVCAYCIQHTAYKSYSSISTIKAISFLSVICAWKCLSVFRSWIFAYHVMSTWMMTHWWVTKIKIESAKKLCDFDININKTVNSFISMLGGCLVKNIWFVSWLSCVWMRIIIELRTNSIIVNHSYWVT